MSTSTNLAGENMILPMIVDGLPLNPEAGGGVK